MKMKLENELQGVIEKFRRIEKKIPAYIEQVKEEGGYNNLEVRVAMDLLRATVGTTLLCEWYDKYDCNDTHIVTLAKRALKEVYPI